MDVKYFDEIHSKNSGGKGALYKFGIILACIVLLLAAVVASQYTGGYAGLGGLVYAAIIYGTYILIRNSNEEYEYIFTDGEVDIDVIRGRSRRKRMLTIKPRDVEVMAKVTGGLYESYKNNQSIKQHLNFSDNNVHNQYFVVLTASSTKKLVLISPSERFITSIKPHLRDRFK